MPTTLRTLPLIGLLALALGCGKIAPSRPSAGAADAQAQAAAPVPPGEWDWQTVNGHDGSYSFRFPTLSVPQIRGEQGQATEVVVYRFQSPDNCTYRLDAITYDPAALTTITTDPDSFFASITQGALATFGADAQLLMSETVPSDLGPTHINIFTANQLGADMRVIQYMVLAGGRGYNLQVITPSTAFDTHQESAQSFFDSLALTPDTP